jgi:hypothetical protein
MPVIGNNQNGVNGYYDVGGQESAYGAQKRLEESTKAAPMPPAPGVNAPKKAQRKAVSGQTAPSEAPPAVPVEQQLAAAPPLPANVWAEVAAIPGISPLAAEWANAQN